MCVLVRACVCLCANLCTLLPCLKRRLPSKRWRCGWGFELAAVWILCILSLFHLFAVTNLIVHFCSTGSPRGDKDVGEVTFHADPVSVRFEVTAFPTPTEVTFTFLGLSANGTGSPQTEPDGIRLEGVCGPHKAVVFRSTCFVIVFNVTTQRAAGFYRVTVTNTQGSAHFRL